MKMVINTLHCYSYNECYCYSCFSQYICFLSLQLKILDLSLLLEQYLLTLDQTSSYLFISHLKPVLCPWTSGGLKGQSSFISIRTGRRKQTLRTEWVCPSRSWREEILLWLWGIFNHQIQESIHAVFFMMDVCKQE